MTNEKLREIALPEIIECCAQVAEVEGKKSVATAIRKLKGVK